MDFENALTNKVRKLANKYGSSNRKVASHLLWWTCSLLFKKSRNQNFLLRSVKKARAAGDLRFLFIVGGGLGDVVTFGPYLKSLYRYFGDENVVFTVAGNFSVAALAGIFRGYSFVDAVDQNDTQALKARYDAVFDMNRLPNLVVCNWTTIKNWDPKVGEYIERLNGARAARPALFHTHSASDYMQVAYMLANGRSMRTQYDFDGTLGLTDAERSLAALDENAADVLSKNGLRSGAYITLQRGVGGKSSKRNVRNWPARSYQELLRKIRAEFPDLKTVLLGQRLNREDGEETFDVDLDLRDATSFEELKVLLKNTALHIDGECGMVHVAYVLGARSAVFWGQTQPAYCGYSENINVFAPNGCPWPCGFSINDWQTNCARGFEEPPCMTRLTPEFFFDAIRPALREILERPKYEWERVEETTAQTLESADVSVDAEKGGETAATLFLGDFSLETLLEARRGGKRVFWFALRSTPKQLAEAREAGVDADWADATNVPAKDGTLDRIVCDVEEPSELVRREILRVAKIGGTARFGKSGGVWRKRVVKNGETAEN